MYINLYYTCKSSIAEAAAKKDRQLLLAVIDVRDCAKLHVKAMLKAGLDNQRICLYGGTINMWDIARHFSDQFPSNCQCDYISYRKTSNKSPGAYVFNPSTLGNFCYIPKIFKLMMKSNG